MTDERRPHGQQDPSAGRRRVVSRGQEQTPPRRRVVSQEPSRAPRPGPQPPRRPVRAEGPLDAPAGAPRRRDVETQLPRRSAAAWPEDEPARALTGDHDLPAPAGVPPRRPVDRARPAQPNPRPRRRSPLRALLALLLVGAIVWVGLMTWAVADSWRHVEKIDDVPSASDRPTGAKGRNYLLVGSDSRAGLTSEQQKELGTGNGAAQPGQRTDSIMVVHLPDGSGDPTLLSIPRDSYVPIRDVGKNKINAAFSIGGAPLLVDTVEQNTGLPIDGYMEIGFGGFASVVDALDGVEVCLDEPIADDKAHIDLPAGCQTLDGKNALGFVRARYFDPTGDIGRVRRQRQFLSALSKRAASPGVLANPFRVHSVGTTTGDAVAVGEDTSMKEAVEILLAVRKASGSEGHSLTVPAADLAVQTPAGTALTWDEAKAQALFQQLRNDEDLTAG